MNLFIILIIIDTILQLVVCHFNLWWVIAVIARICFSLRIIGATIKVQRLAVIEGIAWGSMIIFNMIFAKGHIPWLRILLFAIFSIASVIIMFLDDILYVYVIEDDEE